MSEFYGGSPALFHGYIDGRVGFPGTAGEIGDVDGVGTVRYRPFAQRALGNCFSPMDSCH